MKKTNKVRWDPIIARLADNTVNQKICADTNNHDNTSKKEKWVVAIEKRRSKKDFLEFIHELINVRKSKSIIPKHKKSKLVSKKSRIKSN